MSTRWKPDTCGCIVVYDTRLQPPKADVDIINVRFEHTCPLHSHIEEYGERFEAVKAQNRSGG